MHAPAPGRVASLCLCALALVAASACTQAPPEPVPPPVSANPLIGAWQVASIGPTDTMAGADPAQPGLWIFAEGHYSAVFNPTAEPRVPAAVQFQPTDAEKIAEYDSIIVNTGTYSIEGSTITMRPIIAKSPGFVGGSSTSTFAIDGDTLTFTNTTIMSADGSAPPNDAGTMTLRRLR